jgi:hypothetical protein
VRIGMALDTDRPEIEELFLGDGAARASSSAMVMLPPFE